VSYGFLLERFEVIYAQRDLETIVPDEIFRFLETMTKDMAKSTRRLRYDQLKAFYNFIVDTKLICTSFLWAELYLY
jgi:hypothetical protein